MSLSNAVTQSEGNSGTTAFVWTLTLNRDGSTAAYPYNWAVSGSGTNAANAADFGGTFPSGSGTFASGETSKTITVLVAGDTAVEPNDTFTLTVTASGLTTVTSTGTISNDDTASTWYDTTTAMDIDEAGNRAWVAGTGEVALSTLISNHPTSTANRGAKFVGNPSPKPTAIGALDTALRAATGTIMVETQTAAADSVGNARIIGGTGFHGIINMVDMDRATSFNGTDSTPAAIAGAGTFLGPSRTAVRWGASNSRRAICVNGGNIATASTGTAPPAAIYIGVPGSYQTDTQSLQGYSRRIKVWAAEASDAEMVSRTTVSFPAGPANLSVPKIIVDTDLAQDVDDMGALAVLIAAHKRGDCQIIGVITTTPFIYSAPCARATLNTLGLTGVPVGAYMGSVGFNGSAYAQQIASEFGQSGKTRADFPDAVTLMRQLLAANSNVVINTIGGFQSVAALLQSPADGISSMTGMQLVTAKVDRLVMMGGIMSVTEGAPQFYNNEFNFQEAPTTTAYVLANWPTKRIISDWRMGNVVNTIPPSSDSPTTNPFKRAYDLFAPPAAGRGSWDPIATLFAIYGTSGGMMTYAHSGGTLTYTNPTMSYDPETPGLDTFIWRNKAYTIAQMKARIEADMTLPTGSVVVDGDSIPAGQFSSPSSYVAVRMLGYGAGLAILNPSVSGETMATGRTRLINGEYDSGYVSVGPSIFVEEKGINDLSDTGGSTSATALYAILTDVVARAKAKGFYVIACTLLPRKLGVYGWSSAQEAQRVAYNDLVRGNAAGADGIMDQAANPTMGDAANSTNNTALYADGLHPTNAGQDALVPTWRNAIAAQVFKVKRDPTAASNNLRFTAVAPVTETANGTGYNYKASGTGFFGQNGYAYSNAVIAANADGAVVATIPGAPGTACGILMGVSASASPTAFSQLVIGLYTGNTPSTYVAVDKGTASKATTVAWAANDVIRFRRAGTTYYAEVSKDNGSTWVVAYTVTGGATGVLSAYLESGENSAGGTIALPRIGAVSAAFTKPTDANVQPYVWGNPSDASSVTSSGGAVSAVANKGSSGGSASQATAANQPGLSTLAGRTALLFDSGTKYLDQASVNNGPYFDLWMTVSIASGIPADARMAVLTSTQAEDFNGVGGLGVTPTSTQVAAFRDAGNGGNVFADYAGRDTLAVVRITGGASVPLTVTVNNGTPVVSTRTITQNLASLVLRLGAGKTSSGANNPYRGKIAEWATFHAAIDAASVAGMWTYMARSA